MRLQSPILTCNNERIGELGTRLYDPLLPATDPVDAVWALAEERASKGTEGNRDPEGWVPFAIRRLGPALRAAAIGHVMEWDPPAALTSLSRWTCTRCGEAVLYREPEAGSEYGSALTEPCKETPRG